VSLTDIAAGLIGYDVLYVTHPFDFGGWSSAACVGMKNFLAKGKGVVLEWDAVVLPFNSLGANIYVNSTPQCALFSGIADRGKSVGYNTPVVITDIGSPLVTGLTSPFSMGAASDYMYQITGYDQAIWKVSATYAGWSAASNPALMYGRYKGGGCVALGTMAFGDNGYSSLLDMSSRTLFLNMIRTASPGPTNCRGALDPGAVFPIPTTSPETVFLLLAMLCGSGLLLRRQRARGLLRDRSGSSQA
jgi:hypothetical protein